jgi:predicted TIM-barrel fold metal-dependent hydrolase
MGWIDYWCNAFTPDRRALWDAAIQAQGIPLKVRRDEADSFADADTMLARMDELAIDTLVLPSAKVPVNAGPTEYERFTTTEADVRTLAEANPGRFAGAVTIDPTEGIAGVERAREALALGCFVALHVHTHSWDRPFDHRDYYPYYALAAEKRVPVVMQAGTSGGLMASECGRPIGIDRPALYFRGVDFVLSHTGWPWVDEAIAMAQKHPNVFLGTAAFPPHHWSTDLVRFIGGAGRGKVMLGTSFPVVGHRHALSRLDSLELAAEARAALLEGTARRVFRGLGAHFASDEGGPR